MASNTQEKFVKILAEYQDDDGVSSIEGLRAIALGNKLYEVRNIPIFASGVRLFDIVHCREFPNEDICPTIMEVVTPGGYETIGIIFPESVGGEQQAAIFESLSDKTANLFYERVSKTHIAIAISNEDSKEICQLLELYNQQGEIEFY